MKLLDRLEESPPFQLYYLARENGKHPGIVALSKKSGLSQSTIQRLAKAISWQEVKIGTLDRFCKAVRQDFVSNMSTRGAAPGSRCFLVRPFKAYLSRIVERNPKNPLRHLTALQKKRFLKLCAKWKAARELPF